MSTNVSVKKVAGTNIIRLEFHKAQSPQRTTPPDEPVNYNDPDLNRQLESLLDEYHLGG